MALYAIGDLHLSFGVAKPMDIFKGWDNYVARLEQNWRNLISAEDVIVLAGDISWAMNFEEAVDDFAFIHSLPGEKIILKGNHDYWWNSMAKLEAFVQENGFHSISFLLNNSYVYEDVSICGTRGWVFDAEEEQNVKISAREAGRLELSLKSAQADKKIVFLHYPPLYQDFICQPIVEIMNLYNVQKCYYGHLHGISINYAKEGVRQGINYKLISADALAFSPIKILD